MSVFVNFYRTFIPCVQIVFGHSLRPLRLHQMQAFSFFFFRRILFAASKVPSLSRRVGGFFSSIPPESNSGIYIVHCVGCHPTRSPVRALSERASPPSGPVLGDVPPSFSNSVHFPRILSAFSLYLFLEFLLLACIFL